jgi:hypothetical protein
MAIVACLAQATPAMASSTGSMYVTLYGWDDNSPPGCDIAYPQIHSCAGGAGTYSDPATFATDASELPTGTIVYYPPLDRYFIMEDDCTECDEDWTGQGPDGGPGYRHIDLWAGGASGDDASALEACEDQWTSNGQSPVIVDPPSGEPVADGGKGGPIFVASTSHCWAPGDNGGPATATAGALSNAGTGKCLDDTNWSTAAWTQMQIWDCTGNSNQEWARESNGLVKNDFSGLCLDVDANSSSDFTSAIQYGCNSSDQGQVFTWKWTSFSGEPDGYEIVNDHGMCLDVDGDWNYDGNTVDWYTCNHTGAQDWTWAA